MPRKRTAESSSDCESDSDYNPEVERRKTRTVSRKRKKTRVPTEKAAIVHLAVNEATSKAAAKDIDQGVLSRIKKALALASHAGTGEKEAKQAMRIAFQLMAQHNVSQADLLASEKESDNLKRAGQSCVEIRSSKAKTLRCYDWMYLVSLAVEELFDCNSYSTSYEDRLVWTFYGLCEATVAAAYSFEMAFNLIMEWSESKKWKLIYRSGVGDGLFEFAEREREKEVERVQAKERAALAKARAEEEEEDRRRWARLADPSEREGNHPTPKKSVIMEDVPDEEALDRNPPTTITLYNYGPVEQEDDEDCEGADGSEDGRPGADFEVRNGQEVIDVDAIDEILQNIEVQNGENERVKREEEAAEIPSEVKEKEKGNDKQTEQDDQTPWSSEQQLTLFRKNATRIAEDWLKKKKIKIEKASRSRPPKLKTEEQWEVFDQGVEDAKKIDLKRKRIKEFGEDEVEPILFGFSGDSEESS